MLFDLVLCTYNSSKWIKDFINSVINVKYDLSNISLIFYDNCSNDNTVSILKSEQKKFRNLLNSFTIKQGNINKGFGYGNNKAAELGSSPFIFIVNVDTKLYEDTFIKLESKIKSSNEDIAIWELAQEPFEHPKYYNPVSLETSWASGACMIVRREIFNKIGGFDTNIFMYCEDVELSWRIRSLGYKITYLDDVPIVHYSYTCKNEFKYTQFVYGFLSNWYLRAKYGTFRDYLAGIFNLLKLFKGHYIPQEIKSDILSSIRKLVFKRCFIYFIPYMLLSFRVNKKYISVAQFYGINDYEISKRDPFFTRSKLNYSPPISILTKGKFDEMATSRLNILLDKQIYKNFYILDINLDKFTVADFLNKLQSDYFIILNNDVLPYPDFLYALIESAVDNGFSAVYSNAFLYKGSIDDGSYNIGKIFHNNNDDMHNKINIPILFNKDIFNENDNDVSVEAYINNYINNIPLKVVDRTTSIIDNC